ncbi:MAG TPA: FecR domain-containing protein, partial [Planctomicrobium sp.]|nr:FecR domain-containing protein [Planctomicrobium sp.]
AAGVAILVLMGVTVALFNRNPPAGEGQWAHFPPDPFPSERCAIIEQVHFTGNHPVPTRLREMEDLQTGQELFVETDVYAQLRFDRGARLLIRGPSRLTLQPNGVDLRTGQLLGNIPPEAVGFTVHLGQALVRDLGTRFAVSHDGDLTQVATLDGKVQLELLDHQGQQQVLPLVGGESAQMNPETGEFSRLAEVPVVLNDILAYDSGIVEIDGRMRYCLERPASIATPVSSNPGDVQFWLERIAVPLSTGVSFDIHPKGKQVASLLPRPSIVDSYLFRQRAPTPGEGLDSATGSVTFHQPIVGVISTSASLFQSDSAFAEEQVALDWAKQPERTKLLRGTESRDELKISEDGRTLSFVLAANTDPKEFRVLVESGSVEEPDVPGEGLHFGKRDTNLHCVTYGAGYVWCGMASANSIVSIDPETMKQKVIPIKGSSGLHDLSFDGEDIWGVHSSGHITRLNPASGKVQTIKANGFAYTSHFDGRDIWVGMYTDPGQVLRLDRKTLQLETFVIPEAPKWSVRGLASDGRRLWATLYTSPAMVAVVDPQTRSHQI